MIQGTTVVPKRSNKGHKMMKYLIKYGNKGYVLYKKNVNGGDTKGYFKISQYTIFIHQGKLPFISTLFILYTL